jgi:multimeric flavodoxin WrbA
MLCIYSKTSLLLRLSWLTRNLNVDGFDKAGETVDKKSSDKVIMQKLGIDSKTLEMFKQVQEDALNEAKEMGLRNNKKIKVLGISGSARDSKDMAQEDSNSEALLKKCLESCKKMGADVELIPLRTYDIKHCKACYSTANTHCHFYCTCYPKGKPTGDDMTNILYDKIIGADAIIFATPVNNFKISTLMATFIDRCISLDGSLGPANPKNPKDKALNVKQMKFIEMTADNNVPGSGLLRRFLGKVAGIIVTGHEAGASMTISNLFLTLNNFGMLFPPFSHVYAMSSICNPTYKDKEIVTSDCYVEELEMLAKNVMTAVKTARSAKPTDWVYDYKTN